MLIHPQFDPVAFSLGPLAVRWYGLMYMAGFFCFWLLGKRRSAESWRGVSGEDLENLLFYGIFGVILGGRLGYCLFYQPAFYLSHPMQILHVWEGGMSAHGGLLGVIAVMILYGRLHKLSFWTISDFVAPLVPLGLMLGRIGNFINGELWGRPADPALPWAMIFPQAGTALPAIPRSSTKPWARAFSSSRCFGGRRESPGPQASYPASFARATALPVSWLSGSANPTPFWGLQALGLSRGQWLTLPLIFLGVIVMAAALGKAKARRARA